MMVDTYVCPRPREVEAKELARPELLTNPLFPRPWTVDTMIYSTDVVLKYACPRPSRVEENLVELTYRDPRPSIVDVRPPALRY
jgi:hypothetical protein